MSFWCPQFFPNKEWKQVDLRFHSNKVGFVCSFFGRKFGLKKSFRLCLTFKIQILWEGHRYVFEKKIFNKWKIFRPSHNSWTLIYMHLNSFCRNWPFLQNMCNKKSVIISSPRRQENSQFSYLLKMLSQQFQHCKNFFYFLFKK